MFAAVLAAALAPAQPPAALPERWLLNLAPADLPRTPPDLYAQTWYDAHLSRAISRAWQLWVQFRPADQSRPATASLTRLGERERIVPGEPPEPVYRTLPLAIHGPLVEFDRKLYTAVVRPFRGGKKGDPVPQLHLGAAVEVKDRVWYQAGTVTSRDGKSATVEEWKLDFHDDPRTADAGTVVARSHQRPLTERGGKAFMHALRFTAEGPTERTPVRVVRLHAADGAKGPRLPYLQLGNDRGLADVIWVDGMDRMTLTPASRPAPVRLEPDAPGLVQPPVK